MTREKDEEETELEAKLFGNLQGSSSSVTNFLKKSANSNNKRIRKLSTNILSLNQTHSTDIKQNINIQFVIDKQQNKADTGSDYDSHSVSETASTGDRSDSGSSTDIFNTERHETRNTAKTAAWVDEDDNKLVLAPESVKRHKKEETISAKELSSRLREQHEQRQPKAYRNRQWTKAKDPQKVSEFDRLLATGKRLVAVNAAVDPTERTGLATSARLPNGKIDVDVLPDANKESPCNSIVSSVSWHKDVTTWLFLTAGLDKTLRLFKVSPLDNTKSKFFHSVFIDNMPITCAKFVSLARNSSATEVVCTGQRKYFYSMDLETGKVKQIPGLLGREEKELNNFEMQRLASYGGAGQYLGFTGYDGNVLLVSSTTKQLVGKVKMNGQASCLAFSDCGRYLYSSGSEGYVYLWDIRNQAQCVEKHVDFASTGTTKIAVSANSTHYATGLNSGTVNVYTNSDSDRSKPKVVMNLTTKVTLLEFNHDGQLLLFSLRVKSQSAGLKLVNMNNMQVVPNWPSQYSPIKYVQSGGFSSDSKLVAIGNDRGRALLFRINHYHNT